MYAISRLKAALKAWYWVVHLKRRGKMLYRRFYDLKHGGSRRALAAEIAWRDQQLGRTRVFTLSEFHQQKRSNNTSGVPGVHFLNTERQPHGAWQATLKRPNGKRISRTFSVRRFGNKDSFKRAVAARRDMLALIEDRPYLRSTVAKRFAARSG